MHVEGRIETSKFEVNLKLVVGGGGGDHPPPPAPPPAQRG